MTTEQWLCYLGDRSKLGQNFKQGTSLILSNVPELYALCLTKPYPGGLPLAYQPLIPPFVHLSAISTVLFSPVVTLMTALIND